MYFIPTEDRPVVELFNKNHTLHSADVKRYIANSSNTGICSFLKYLYVIVTHENRAQIHVLKFSVLEANEEILENAAVVKKEKVLCSVKLHYIKVEDI